MSETIHVFVGTDERMGRAERVLEHSIQAHTKEAVEIHWMRAGEGRWTGWAAQPALPYFSNSRRWATHFSGFRFAVPELCREIGCRFGIYLDADMALLAPIEELYAYRKPDKWNSSVNGMAVMVIDSEAKTSLPSIAEMKKQAVQVNRWMSMVPAVRTIPGEWNCCDGLRQGAKLIHWTNMETQPWKPWPERFSYTRAHRDPKAYDLFFKLEEEVNASQRSHTDMRPA